MLSRIFKKQEKAQQKSSEAKKIQEKVSNMNLTEMRSYIKNNTEGLTLSEAGINEVLKRLISKINDSRYFLDESDDDSKLKKGFELVLEISKNRKVNFKSVELIAAFLQTYDTLIRNYDNKHKQIYQDRLHKAIDRANIMVGAKASLDDKNKLLDHY